MRIEAFHSHATWDESKNAARFAEAHGFDAFTMPEIDHDPFIPLAFAANATARIGIRNGICTTPRAVVSYLVSELR